MVASMQHIRHTCSCARIPKYLLVSEPSIRKSEGKESIANRLINILSLVPSTCRAESFCVLSLILLAVLNKDW